MELKWSFIINGNYPYLNNLIYFLDSDDLLIYEEGEEGIDLTQYFSSYHFNHLIDPNDVYSKGFQLLSFLNAIDILIQENKENHNRITLDRLIDIENNRVVYYDKFIQINKIDIDFTVNQILDNNNTNVIAKIIKAAKTNEFIQNLLFIISKGMDFENMYKALDEIKYFLKQQGFTLDDIGFPKKGKINNFTHTANNFQTLGVAARHGNLGHDAPISVMDISDAQKLITDVIKKVFHDFFQIQLPIKKDISFDVNDIF